MDCPKCKFMSLVQKKVADEVEIDVCPICKGLWLEADELNELLSVAVEALPPPQVSVESKWNCPVCSVPLKAFNYPRTQVKIDMCPDCLGIWLDSKEFSEIKAVRESLHEKGELKGLSVKQIKGSLLEWIDAAIAKLTTFD